jgi:hypothetical protein
VSGWLSDGDTVDHCRGVENGHPLLKKKRPQKVRPEAASISGVRLPWFPLMSRKSGHPANQDFSTKVVPTSATTRCFDQLSQPSD